MFCRGDFNQGVPGCLQQHSAVIGDRGYHLLQLFSRLVKHAYHIQLLKAVTTLKLCPCTLRFSLCFDAAKLPDLRTMPQKGAQSLLELDVSQDL